MSLDIEPETATPAVTSADIDAAAERLRGIARTTPLQLSQRLSEKTGVQVWLKREDLQPVRSYKVRGAYNLISQLTKEQRAAGVICASAGNHGQGVALACAKLGVTGRIYVPSTTPRQKRERMIALGNGHIELVIAGDTYDDAYRAARDAVAETGMIMVPAFDDARTIAGQATVAHEIVEQLGKAPDVVLVPVGGGGMVAGVLTWFSENYPQTRVIGIEPAGAPCMQAALEAGKPVILRTIDTFVDGAAVRKAGEITYEIASRLGLEIMVVSEGCICSEMLALYQVDGIIAEPAGAMASSVFDQWSPEPGQTVVAILSGGNNDVSRYAEVIERALVYEGRKHYFLISFPQEPGALRRFLDEVLGPNDDITYFEYVKRDNREFGPALVGIELGDPNEFEELMRRMRRSRIVVEKVDQDSSMGRFLIA
ncbi:MAG: threonine ammonia-lyase IlvA [Thermomicrobiales bacterium]|nr:threonine ammonia-lyase IlvA [Thermomicrobiales bacterium]MCO5217825.1 threonine ammonia-lyase IlvA [Thermomicrobiales bacterium]MCO5223917.1 threonine ammonia-lyase IlvA [Thermomicrobiales bacterium]MCO5227480.1 threonine ammonia-lyase IlvA [Thermomicrobiales bacterium]